MKVDMVMPQMGESIAEGTILKWIKKEGDAVARDENVLEISTDKVDSEIPSPAAGRLVEIRAKEGETIAVGEVIAVLETEEAAEETDRKTTTGPAARSESRAAAEPEARSESKAPEQPAAPSEPKSPARPAAATGSRPGESELPAAPSLAETLRPAATDAASAGAAPAAVARSAAPGGAARTAGGDTGGNGPIPRQADGRFYSPLVRSIARQEGISLQELSRVPGSGRAGRVTKDDLLEYLTRRETPAPRPEAVATGTLAPAVPALPGFPGPARPAPGAEVEAYPAFTVSESRTTGEGRVDVVGMDKMRQIIAEHMVRSKATSPHVASVTEVDMTAIVRYREAMKAPFQAEHGFKLTYTPFLVLAAVRGLLDYPMMNSTVEDHQILIKRYLHVGVAVALDAGLIVPVIKHAEERNFLGIARAVDDLSKRARSKELKPDEVAGGTFTLTNMGSFGNLFGIPIINQPQSGILGVGAIVKRPVVVGDAIGIRDIMYLSLSYDHRHIDGKLGGLFLQRVRHHLESFDPSGI
jgi:pyruvate dehydrogenase E2 component (dihydrolipoamide acetyltransferase)